jgi:serine/threonine protein kinase
VGQPSAAPVALKVALLPGDPRFPREAELLSRMSHLHVPRLVEQGEWQAPDGARYQFIAMEWIDGVPLYDWARLHPVSCHQVRLWLSQLARALAALHAQGGVHRDVKGANVLVRREERCAVLTDLGTGTYAGATTLTPPHFYPGTPAYQAPEVWLFARRFRDEPTAHYQAGPADDLYALGVTACRLLTGEYPGLPEPVRDEQGSWQLGTVRPPPALLSDSWVEPGLRAVVLRLLSVHPEQRGTISELVEALEHAPMHATAECTRPGFRQDSLVEARAGRLQPQVSARHWLSVAAVGLLLVLWAQWSAPRSRSEEPTLVQGLTSEEGSSDTETAGLGETAASMPVEQAPAQSTREGLTADTLPEPVPGQRRPNEKGQCPRRGQVALNNGCWAANAVDREDCAELDGQMYKGTCYVPFIPRGRRPNSSHMDKR